MAMTSRKPSVVTSAVRTPLRSVMALITVVPPWTKKDISLRREPGLATLRDRMNDALRRILRRGQRLADINLAGSLFEGDKVGERAAGVRGNFDHRAAPGNFARSSSVAARSTFCVSGWITTP